MHKPTRALSFAIPFVLGASLLFTGCAKGPKERLQGRWVGAHIDNIPKDQEGRALGWVKSTSFEFRGGRVTVAVPAEEPRTGEFKVVRSAGNKLTVEIARPGADPEETVFTLVDERTLKWDIGNDRSVTFEKTAMR